jgi:hypothetical protein
VFDLPVVFETVLRSIAKTNRVLVVEEGPRVGGWAANLLGIITAEGLEELDDARIVTTADAPAPYGPTLEDAWLACAAESAAAVRERLGPGSRLLAGAPRTSPLPSGPSATPPSRVHLGGRPRALQPGDAIVATVAVPALAVLWLAEEWLIPSRAERR